MQNLSFWRAAGHLKAGELSQLESCDMIISALIVLHPIQAIPAAEVSVIPSFSLGITLVKTFTWEWPEITKLTSELPFLSFYTPGFYLVPL